MEHNLFPTKLYRFQSNIDTQMMIKPILDLEVGKDLHYGQESGGLQGGGWIYDTEVFDSIRLYINQTIEQTFNSKCNILDTWVSIYKKGDYNKIHNHPATNPMYYDSNLWAGVFYIKTNKDSGRLVIHSPQNPTNTEDFYPDNGELFLFNSHTYHSVTPNLSDSDRICIAFNFTI